MFSSALLRLAEVVIADARAAKLRVATAESCTGGVIGGLLTEIPGSSAVFDRGFIVYTNRAKQDLLNVPGDLIADMGEVSEAVARMMAEGAVENSNAQLAVRRDRHRRSGRRLADEAVGLVHVAACREGPLDPARSAPLRRHRADGRAAEDLRGGAKPAAPADLTRPWPAPRRRRPS
ncbi:MAG: nicotinamide-nucleotide amidohydrolase family protein [Rhizomicrobium sp.]